MVIFQSGRSRLSHTICSLSVGIELGDTVLIFPGPVKRIVHETFKCTTLQTNDDSYPSFTGDQVLCSGKHGKMNELPPKEAREYKQLRQITFHRVHVKVT